MPIQAVIFDMDGLLIDSEVVWLQERQAFAATHGKTWTVADHHAAMGRNTLEWARVMRDRLQIDLTPAAIVDEMQQRMLLAYERQLPLLPGALEAVHLAATTYPVALASGSPKILINQVMRLSGLDQVFQHIVYGDDMPRGKPAPDVYFHTANLLNVSPAACVGLEDSPSGIRALQAVGMAIIAVPSTATSLS